MTHHVKDYLQPSLPTEHLLFSKHLIKIVYGSSVYDARTGELSNSIDHLTPDCSDTIPPVLLLDGNYVAVISLNGTEMRLINSRNGAEISRVPIHNSHAVHLKVGQDDRTIYISTRDGRVLVFITTLELCDPITMLINNLPSRQRNANRRV